MMDPFLNHRPLPPIFPSDMLSYILKKPPRFPTTQEKLIRIAKIFFATHRILPITSNMISIENLHQLIHKYGNLKTPNFRVNIPEIGCKFWIFDCFLDHSIFEIPQPNSMAPIMPYIYTCHLTALFLFNLTIYKKEWLFLLSDTVRQIEIKFVNILNDDETILSLAEIIKSFPKKFKKFT